ncbi:hypothetical protein HPG69_013901 [Diceros bicornis minor]|uniref:Uncharacterized protein n=1 Tax=Diceros bicornis minor TaxID=77932 RepID=A0A7J7EMK1_DICBM|nr:hypothetical protein HPG69_013901 [Diceros bicornis minor]
MGVKEGHLEGDLPHQRTSNPFPPSSPSPGSRWCRVCRKTILWQPQCRLDSFILMYMAGFILIVLGILRFQARHSPRRP